MDFYYMIDSPPCRSILMTAKALGVELNLKVLDLMTGDHLKPEFVKLNPQHTIPTLVDNGFALWESRAILVYLAEKYGKDGALYPTCPTKRAVVNQRLYFDMGTLYQRFADYYYPVLFYNSKEPLDPEKFKKMEEAFGFLDIFLDGQQYVAGENLTIADISLVATVSTYEAGDFPISKYPNVAKWYKHCQSVIPGIEMNKTGAEEFKKYFEVLKH